MPRQTEQLHFLNSDLAFFAFLTLAGIFGAAGGFVFCYIASAVVEEVFQAF